MHSLINRPFFDMDKTISNIFDRLSGIDKTPSLVAKNNVYELKFDIPDIVKEDDINIEVEDDVLYVEYHAENSRSSRDFTMTETLPSDANSNEVDAWFDVKNHQLVITINKIGCSNGHKVNIHK